MLEQHRKGATDGKRSIAIDARKREIGGKRKGRSMKKNPRAHILRPNVTVGMAKAAYAIDPNASYDTKRKMLVYKREA